MKSEKIFVIWGSAGHAKVLNDVINRLHGKVISVFDNSIVPSAILNTPIYYGEEGFFKWKSMHSSVGQIHGLVAIGGAKGRDRLEIQNFLARNGLKISKVIDTSASVSPSAEIGLGSQVLPLARVAADTKIGDACIINHGANLDHECIVGDGTHIAPSATICGCVNIGMNVFIGAGAIVLPRLNIGSDCIIGAGAVVTTDVPSGCTVVGVPARLIDRQQ